MSSIAPVALFVYNRPDHTRRTLNALQDNLLADQTQLFVFADGARDETDGARIADVQRVLDEVSGFRSVTVVHRERNLGLAGNITRGVSEMLEEFEQAIFLEDDLLTSPFFLKYMNDGLSLYRDEQSVISIHGYIYPVRKKLPDTFFIRGADCWGWATWRGCWNLYESDGRKLLESLEKEDLAYRFNFDDAYPYLNMLQAQVDGRNDSWAIRWYASAFLRNKLTLYPGVSLVRNIGNDGSGRHSKKSGVFDTSLTRYPIVVKKIPLKESKYCRRAIKKFFQFRFRRDNPLKNLLYRLMKYLKKSVSPR